MKKNLLRPLGLLVLAGWAASCSVFNLPVPEVQKGSLVISASVGSTTPSRQVFSLLSQDRTLTPQDWTLLNDLRLVRLTFKPQPSGSTVVIELDNPQSPNPPNPQLTVMTSAPSGFVLNLQDIPAGAYKLDLEVLNADGKVYMAGSVNTPFTITGGTSNTLPSGITVSPVSSKDGVGATFIKINYPMGYFVQDVAGVPAIYVKKIAWPLDGPQEPSVVTSAAALGWALDNSNVGDTSSMTGDLEIEATGLSSGLYEIRLRFSSTGITGTSSFPYDFVETLHIYDNVMTHADWWFSEANFGSRPAGPLAPDMVPFAQKFPGVAAQPTVNRVVLNWKLPPLGSSGYPEHIGFGIFRREGYDVTNNPDAPWTLVHQTGPYDETFTDTNGGTGLPSDVRLDYRVAAVTFAGRSNDYLEALNMGISSGAELEMRLMDREVDLTGAFIPQTVDLDSLYGRTPYFNPMGMVGGTFVPVMIKNNGQSDLLITSLLVNNMESYAGWQLMDSAKQTLPTISNPSVEPGDYIIILLTYLPTNSVNLPASFGTDLSFNVGAQGYMVSFSGNVRDNNLYVSHESNGFNWGNDANPGLSDAPLASIDKALEFARDGDTIKIASAASPYYAQGKIKIRKRVHLEGDYSPDGWSPLNGTVSSTTVAADPYNTDPQSNYIINRAFQFEDIPVNTIFPAKVSKINIWGEGGAPEAISLLRSHVVMESVFIKSGNADPGKPLALVRVEGMGTGGSSMDYITFNGVIFQFPYLTSAPSDLSYLILEGSHRTKVLNSRFETMIDTGNAYYPTGTHYGIRLHPDPAKGTGEFILQDSAVEVGDSTGAGTTSYGIYVNAGSPGTGIGLYRNKFRFIGGNGTNTDTAVYFRQAGLGEYKPLLESNRFYFNLPQPMVGVHIHSSLVRALVYQNMFMEAGDTSGSENRGIIDAGTDTRIFNNTFSTRLNNSTYQPSFYWIEIPVTYAAPRVVNNLFASLRNNSGIELQPNSYGLRVVNGGLKPAEFRNNAFMGVSQKFIPAGMAGLTTEADLNNAAKTSDVTGNNRIIYTGTPAQPVYLIQEGMDMAFGLNEGTNERVYDSALSPPWIPSSAVLYGGTDITQGITDWGGPLAPEGLDATLKTALPQNPTPRRSFSWPGAWTIGADEPPSINTEAVSRWMLDGVNATTPQLDDQVGLFATGAYDFGGINSGFTKDDAARTSRFGSADNAVYFNGRSTWAVAGMPSPTVNTDQGWTVGVWFGDVNFKSHPSEDPLQTLVSASDMAGGLGWRLSIKGNTRELLAGTGGGTPSETKAQLPWRDQYRKWNHVFAVFDKTAGTSGRVSLYLNGNPTPLAVQDVDLLAVPFEIGPTGSYLAIGGRRGNAGMPVPEFFYGKLDDVELYNRPITPAEVAAFYESNQSLLDLSPGSIPASQGSTLGAVPTDVSSGTYSTMYSDLGVANATMYTSLWNFDTGGGNGIIQGEYWSSGYSAIRARSMPPTTNLNYHIRGWNSTSGALGDSSANSGLAVVSMEGVYENGFSTALKALWPFGGAGGRSYTAFDGLSKVLAHSSVVGWSNWWDPEWVPEGMSPWAVPRKETGSVWFDGTSFLRTTLTPDISSQDQPSLTAVVRFRFQGTIPTSPNILPLITWGSGISGNNIASRALAVGLQSQSFHRIVFDTANGVVGFDLGAFLSPNKTYTLAVSFIKGTNTVRYYFDTGSTAVSGSLNTFNYGAPPTPSDLVVGGSPGKYFNGWIDEVRIYQGDLLTNGDFYTALSSEYALNTSMVGLPGPGGGKIFYDKGSYSDGWRYLEAAPSDISGLKAFAVTDNGNDVTGTGAGLGAGLNNTSLLVISRTTMSDAGTAPQVADNFSNNGLSDWYLPSKDELLELYVQRSLFGNFQTAKYWSSTDTEDDDAAWAVDFTDGSNASSGNWHSNGGYVRPIRQF